MLRSIPAQSQINSNWKLLADTIGNARIVGIGEEGHGYESINTIKADLTKNLRNEKGFHVILFESSFTLSVIAYLNGDTGTKRLKNFIYPFWNTHPVRQALSPFFNEEQTIKSPLILGFDMQEDCRFRQLSKYLIDKKFVALAKDRLLAGDSILNYYIGKTGLRKTPLTENELFLLNTYYDIVSVELRSKRLPLKTEGLLIRALENRKWLAKYLTIKNIGSRMFFRDSMMAENIKWLKEEIFKGEKILLWAADLHLSKGNMNKCPQWMGERIYSVYRNEYFAISIRKNKSRVKEGKLNLEFRPRTSDFNARIWLKALDKIKPEEWKTPCD